MYLLYIAMYSKYINNAYNYYNALYDILIGWQAYRGDQIHRKNSPT